MQANTSGLEPRGRAVLVQMYEPQKKPGSLIEIPDMIAEKANMLEQRATVVAVGPSCWSDEGSEQPWLFGLFRRWVAKPRAKVGEKVLVTKFAGFQTIGPADGKRYRLVNDRDIFCAITNEGEENG